MLSDKKLRPIYVEAFNKAMQDTNNIADAGLVGLRAVAEAAVKVAEQALCAVGGGEIAKHENAKGFNQGVVYSAAIIAADCATFASELLSSAGITRVKAREFKCDDHDISCIDEHSAWPKNKGS